jgi:hypothetical protein
VTDQSAADAQTFLDVLRNDPALLADCAEALARVVEAVKTTGKKGAVTLKVTIHRPPKSDPAVVWITGGVTHSAPSPDREDRMFFAVDGRLSRRDPRQPDLPMLSRVASTHEEEPAGASQAEAM